MTRNTFRGAARRARGADAVHATPTCPYCGAQAVLEQTRFGYVWSSTPCDARVGCHKDTTTPKGSLANAALRAARIAAHGAFDVLWQAKQRRKPEISRNAARRAAYQWLAFRMSIPAEDCHIALFDVRQCMRVVEICAPFATMARRALQEPARGAQ